MCCCFLLWLNFSAGVECKSDAWSEYTPSASPAGRQEASMVWDTATQSAWMFGGHASNAFLYFADLWHYDWPRRAWAEILPLNEGPTPGSRWGHAAVWDSNSRSMLIFAGRSQVTFYDDTWQFRSEGSTWTQLPAKPSARAYHTAILDPVENAVLVFGGETSNAGVLEDLQRYSLADGQWSESPTTGAGARSRHTAVWVPTTRSMLVFGGWSGQQYLDDLRSYDASAGTWTDLSAAGYWPAARAGHAAAWDPVSMSMLVMGGITNGSNDLSYDASLYNYSLLTNSWKEEGLQTEISGPTGRSGHAIVWDDSSRGLLSFGGFNASYLHQTWRYVVSQTSSPWLVNFTQGRNCSFRWNASGFGAVKRTCSDADTLAGLLLSEAEDDLWRIGGSVSPFLAEPGHHRLCWCDTNCSHPDNFSVTVGYFVVEGPQLRQSAQCYLGRDCTISEWRGVGISVNDSIVMKSRCSGEAQVASTYSQRSVTISFNESYGWYTLHVGFLDPTEGLQPEALELCWCPAMGPCASTEDFRVVALSLDVICPPGEYSEGPGSFCLPCPANHFCRGGSDMQSCPSASTSAQGSSPPPSRQHRMRALLIAPSNRPQQTRLCSSAEASSPIACAFKDATGMQRAPSAWCARLGLRRCRQVICWFVHVHTVGSLRFLLFLFLPTRRTGIPACDWRKEPPALRPARACRASSTRSPTILQFAKLAAWASSAQGACRRGRRVLRPKPPRATLLQGWQLLGRRALHPMSSWIFQGQRWRLPVLAVRYWHLQQRHWKHRALQMSTGLRF